MNQEPKVVACSKAECPTLEGPIGNLVVTNVAGLTTWPEGDRQMAGEVLPGLRRSCRMLYSLHLFVLLLRRSCRVFLLAYVTVISLLNRQYLEHSADAVHTPEKCEPRL
jgi:hypothetical protein